MNANGACTQPIAGGFRGRRDSELGATAACQTYAGNRHHAAFRQNLEADYGPAPAPALSGTKLFQFSLSGGSFGGTFSSALRGGRLPSTSSSTATVSRRRMWMKVFVADLTGGFACSGLTTFRLDGTFLYRTRNLTASRRPRGFARICRSDCSGA